MMNKIGATGESVEQFEVTSFLERQNTVLCFFRISHRGRNLPKSLLFIKYSSLSYVSIGSTVNKIGATGESVEQFEIKSFLQRRNTFHCFLRISHKRRILLKKSPLYKMFIIKLRIDW